MRRREPRKGIKAGSGAAPHPVPATREGGFTLVELMMVLLIFSVLTVSAMDLCLRAQKSVGSAQHSSGLLETGLTSLEQMRREIALAGYPGAGSFSAAAVSSHPGIVAQAFVTVSGNDLVFEADVDGDGRVEQIEYVLPPGSETLIRRVTVKNPNGTLATGSTISQIFLEHVQNQTLGRPLFSWEVDPSSSQPFPLNIRAIHISAVVRAKSSEADTPASLSLTATCQRMNL